MQASLFDNPGTEIPFGFGTVIAKSVTISKVFRSICIADVGKPDDLHNDYCRSGNDYCRSGNDYCRSKNYYCRPSALTG